MDGLLADLNVFSREIKMGFTYNISPRERQFILKGEESISIYVMGWGVN
jgi:hypothetical protein